MFPNTDKVIRFINVFFVEKMNSKFYKCCAVPQCENTTTKTPEKLFIHVPRSEINRKMWLQLAGRNPKLVPVKSKMYFCEDHFDLQSDMENYIEYRVMGSVSQIRMRATCLPSKFECQPYRKRRKEKEELECEGEIEQAYSKQNISMVEVQADLSSDLLHPKKCKTITTNKSIQVSISPKLRSKSIQTKIKFNNLAVSAMENCTTSISTSPLKLERTSPEKCGTFSSTENIYSPVTVKVEKSAEFQNMDTDGESKYITNVTVKCEPCDSSDFVSDMENGDTSNFASVKREIGLEVDDMSHLAIVKSGVVSEGGDMSNLIGDPVRDASVTINTNVNPLHTETDLPLETIKKEEQSDSEDENTDVCNGVETDFCPAEVTVKCEPCDPSDFINDKESEDMSNFSSVKHEIPFESEDMSSLPVDPVSDLGSFTGCD